MADLLEKYFMYSVLVLSIVLCGKEQSDQKALHTRASIFLETEEETEVDVPRVRIGNRQSIETLISEEALLLARFLRDEKKKWAPRIAVL